MEIWPELRIDVTVSGRCADRIRAIVEYQGTAAAVERQRERLDFLLAQPAMYMTNWHIQRILDWMGQVANDGPECDGQQDALRLFGGTRYDNPMGRWRERGLQAYWRCAYPDDYLLGGEVTREVPVEVEVVVEREVIKEVKVPGETVVVEKEVIKEVQVPGGTVDAEHCAAVERWIPPSWIPAEERP